MWSFLAAAALAAQPAASNPVEDSDFRCLAVVAVVLGSVPKESVEDLAAVTGLTAIFMYYLGRVDVRYPGLDFVAAFKTLDDDVAFKTGFSAQAERCSTEAERRSQKLDEMGRILRNLLPPPPGHAG
jgi:hypothetical protein